MKKIKTIIIVLALNSIGLSQSEFLDFKFFDASNRIYCSLELKNQIDSIYDYKSNPFVLLMVTNSSDNKEYQKQINDVNSINAEKLQLLFVYSSPDIIYKSGYHTDKATASRLLGNDYNFKIIF